MTSSPRHHTKPQHTEHELQSASTLFVHQLFENTAQQYPNAIAVQCGAQSLSYSALNEMSNRVAALLQSREVPQGAAVGVCIDRSIELMPILLGILKAGAAYLPLDPTFPPERLAYMAEDANAAYLFTQADYEQLLPATIPHFDIHRDWDTLAQFPDENLSLPLPPDSLIYLIYTSGSTGRPKGVQVYHRGVVNLLLSMASKPGLTTQDRMLAVTTICFDMHVPELFLPLCVGARICLISRSIAKDTFKLIDALRALSINTMQATPSTWRMLIRAGWEGSPEFKALIGGEALPPELVEPLLQRCGELWNMYGPTETTVWSTCHRIDSSDGVISVGKPINNTQVYIVTEDNRLAEPPEAGELCIGGRGVAKGYQNRPELTAEKFIGNSFTGNMEDIIYRTGDLARLDENGNIEHLGRIDNQIKVRGYRVEPGEIETALSKHPCVDQAIVALLGTASGDRRLVAFYTASGSAETAALRIHTSELLPSYMVPQHFFTVDQFPLTPNGKIDRRALIESHKDLLGSTAKADTLPKSDLEKAILLVWRRVLDNGAIGVEDRFADAGGESILAIDLILEMRKATGISFPFEKMLENPTVKELVDSVSTKKISNPYNVVPLQPQGEKPPLYCLCGVSLYQELANELGSDQPTFGVYAPMEFELLNEAIAGDKPQIAVENLAERYSEAIIQQKFDMPIQLIGFSFGGLLAVETARVLQQKGHDVSTVILIDTVLPHAVQMNIAKLISSAFRRAMNKLRFKNNAAGEKKNRETLTESQQPKRQRLNRIEALRNKSFDDLTTEYLRSSRHYAGRVVLIKARNNELLTYRDLAEDYGWSRILANPPEIHYVDGQHLDLVRGRSGSQTAAIVSGVLLESEVPAQPASAVAYA